MTIATTDISALNAADAPKTDPLIQDEKVEFDQWRRV
jgi:hypothetical protein